MEEDAASGVIGWDFAAEQSAPIVLRRRKGRPLVQRTRSSATATSL
jgi:hypothetical protein